MWRNLVSAPHDRNILGINENGDVFVMWWDEEVRGGPCFFAGGFYDMWQDRPIYPNPVAWQPFPPLSKVDDDLKLDLAIEKLRAKVHSESGGTLATITEGRLRAYLHEALLIINQLQREPN